jgi:ABC-type transport system substrate-binding protein
MRRRTVLKGAAASMLLPALPVKAATGEKVLRLAMTLADIPLTTGQSSQGGEGIRFIGSALSDSLIQWDLQPGKPGKLGPGLAESWTIDPETKTKWTFSLRKDVKFHDGSAFDAAAVVWNFEKLMNKNAPQFDPAQLTQASSYVGNVKSYRVVDPMTVEIVTKEPDAFFGYRMAQVFYSSPSRWKELGGDWNKYAEHPASTGPWILDKLVPRERAELVRNPNYWNPKRIPKLDRVVLFAMPDATTRVAALLSGQLDWAEAPAPDTVPRLKQSGFQIVTSTFPNICYVWPYWLSYTADSPFRDIRVRKAANLAIDRDGLVDFLGGLALPAKGMMAPGSPWFGSPTFDIKFDPEQAKKLLAEAGYGPNKKCKVKFLTSASGSGQMQPLPMNEFVQQNLQDVGFEVEIEVAEWEALRVRRRATAEAPENKGLYAINNGWTLSDPDFTLLSVTESDRRPPVGNNWGGYNDPVADQMARDAKNEFDFDKQNELVGKLHAYLVDQAMWIWVVHDVTPRAVAKNVKNMPPMLSLFEDLTSVDLA